MEKIISRQGYNIYEFIPSATQKHCSRCEPKLLSEHFFVNHNEALVYFGFNKFIPKSTWMMEKFITKVYYEILLQTIDLVTFIVSIYYETSEIKARSCYDQNIIMDSKKIEELPRKVKNTINNIMSIMIKKWNPTGKCTKDMKYEIKDLNHFLSCIGSESLLHIRIFSRYLLKKFESKDN